MGVTAPSEKIDPVKYGRLCAKAVPKVITSDEELDRMAEQLERLTMKSSMTAEEEALADLLTKLIEDYDDKHYPLPDAPPHRLVSYLMERRGLRQADLVELIGSRSQVSDLVSGKRAISKSQAKKLSAFFKLPVDLFL